MKSLSKVLATAALTTAMFSGVAQAEKLDIGILLPSPIACLLYTSPSPRDS